jgi:thiol-disulfide isomerase/thioredoxin
MDDITCIDPRPAPPRPRRRPTPVVALALLVALLTALVACGGSDGASGKALPDAELTDLRTEEAADWGADGKPLVVNFWASWCTPCKTEMPAFEEVAQDFDGKVVIVGVTDTLDLDGSREAADNAGVTYPLLVDEEQNLQVDLGIAGLPATVFVDADGTIVGRHLGALTRDELTQEIEDRYGIEA